MGMNDYMAKPIIKEKFWKWFKMGARKEKPDGVRAGIIVSKHRKAFARESLPSRSLQEISLLFTKTKTSHAVRLKEHLALVIPRLDRGIQVLQKI